MPNRYQDRPPASFSFGGYRTGDSIADIIMARGQAAADAELRGGEIWGNAFQNIGQTLAGGFQEYGRQQEERKAQEALARARSGAYPSATKPVRGSEFDVPDPGIDHFDAILKTVSPELRPKVEKAIRDADEAASRVESRRMEIEKTKAALAAEERKAQQDGADYGATLAFHVTPFLGAEDGGLSALTTAAQHAKARRIPGAEAYDEFLGKATEAMQQAQQSGDPRAVAAVADSIRKQAEPLLKRMQVGASAGLMEKLRGETEKGVVLGEGATLVDPRDGREIARGAPKQETRSIDVQLAEAAAKGDTVAFGRLLKVKADAARAGRNPDEGLQKVETIENGKRVTKFVRPSAGASYETPPQEPKPRNPTGQERTALSFYNRAQGASEDVLKTEDSIAKYGLVDQGRLKAGGVLGNFLQNDEMQSYRQAQRAFTEARLRKESGANIKDSEYDNDARTYFAVPGDSEATIKQKRAARERVLEGLRIGSGKAYEEYYGEASPRPDTTRTEPTAPSGPAKITSKAAYDALPKGATYIDPTGQVRTKR